MTHRANIPRIELELDGVPKWCSSEPAVDQGTEEYPFTWFGDNFKFPSSRADQGCSGLFWYLRVSGSSLLSCDERSGIELTESPGRDSCLRVTLNERRSLTNNAIGNTPQMRLYRICLQHWPFLRSFLSCHTIWPCPLTLWREVLLRNCSPLYPSLIALGCKK